MLKVLSYWNLNEEKKAKKIGESFLKVLSYWNLNLMRDFSLDSDMVA